MMVLAAPSSKTYTMEKTKVTFGAYSWAPNNQLKAPI
jgi:hypothetical protein